ncbi:surfactin synthase thioesterase subunit [Paenibacillus forsythiae]|uniref:Surfactin synthase thioesterase subunit n=1 Tax=Paenibacillus forsythiae TaxID=365616 RepID=A0ABU3HAS2_9BACL|nr:thioesterase domain-containing protein [Paenibacillus forsythiae]MDT3427546.1 surfactin synthase thioesterase subunit [Paenibacillus forsythiae]
MRRVNRQIKGYIEDGGYALFGHSMGSWLAYEVYYAIRRAGGRLPLNLFVSGRHAPQLETETKFRYG